MGTRLKLWGGVAAARGRSHDSAGMPCQDAVARRFGRHSACIALADGIGSLPYAEIGARVAVKAATAIFNRLPWYATDDDLRHTITGAVQAALAKHARRRKISVSDLGTTLLFFAYARGRFLLFHCGDGIVLMRENGRLRVMSHPRNGRYHFETFSISLPDAVHVSQLHRGAAACGEVVLLSDGAAESIYTKKDGILGYRAIEKLLGWAGALSPRSADAVLAANLHQRFTQNSYDDCSIAILGWSN